MICYKIPSVNALDKGIVAPMPSQIVITVLIKKTVVATGLLKGFWNLFIFSTNGTIIKPAGTAAIDRTPISLLGITLNKLNVGKKYHSGNISSGVANGLAGSPNAVGSKMARPTLQAIVAKMTTVNIYSKSLGQAGSP